MHSIKDIIREASELPVEDRAMVIDSLLRTLNTPDPEIDKAWSEEARRRLDELRSGRITPVPGNEVFSRIKERFEK
jgi:putative addiction module component (TIGR02574 family)